MTAQLTDPSASDNRLAYIPSLIRHRVPELSYADLAALIAQLSITSLSLPALVQAVSELQTVRASGRRRR